MRRRWSRQWRCVDEQWMTHLLDRKEQATMFRLSKGHNRLKAHIKFKFKLFPNPQCSYDIDQHTYHRPFATTTPAPALLEHQRKVVWPVYTRRETWTARWNNWKKWHPSSMLSVWQWWTQRRRQCLISLVTIKCTYYKKKTSIRRVSLMTSSFLPWLSSDWMKYF